MSTIHSDPLQAARAAFADDADRLYVDGALAAGFDADTLEDAAERILAFTTGLEPLFDGLNVARDTAHYRGAVLSRARSRYDPGALAVVIAEVLAEEILSDAAGAVLVAAARTGT